MVFRRGDVVLIPFPYTNLSASKTRPAVVVSSTTYHNIRSELLVAYVSSQLSKVHQALDYVLIDWAISGLPKPSFVRPKIAAIESSLVVHQVGKLSERDLFEVDRRLRLAMALTETALVDVVDELDLMAHPAGLVQTLAEKSIMAVQSFITKNTPGVDLERLRKLLNPVND